MDYIKKYQKMISLRNLADHTKMSYMTYLKTYLEFLDLIHKCPSQATAKDLQKYVIWLKETRNLADRTINAAISQLRFFTIYVLCKQWDPSVIPLRKFDTYLPFVPTKDEVQEFISTIPDLRVKTSKNRSDRYAMMSNLALDLLTKYWFSCGRPMGYLFPQIHNPEKPVDTFYLSRHIHAHEDRLGWPRRLTCHSFRHAYGTHLYENGTDLYTIKALMGHKSLDSTLIYVYLSVGKNITATSPLDLMEGIADG
ncbi:MAG: tyrosine-type recombinase/integrase [Lachnospiraceae bacterium]|nr:tyrosine-type recombinase/integrase [Lachnospiraceae bacterium]